jgi:hypothetical protein
LGEKLHPGKKVIVIGEIVRLLFCKRVVTFSKKLGALSVLELEGELKKFALREVHTIYANSPQRHRDLQRLHRECSNFSARAENWSSSFFALAKNEKIYSVLSLFSL